MSRDPACGLIFFFVAAPSMLVASLASALSAPPRAQMVCWAVFGVSYLGGYLCEKKDLE
jgi:hypothetical protein